jgi:hypothetical protein
MNKPLDSQLRYQLKTLHEMMGPTNYTGLSTAALKRALEGHSVSAKELALIKSFVGV